METVMTYEQWEREHKARSRRTKAKLKYFAIQKGIGALFLIGSVAITPFLQDGTHLLITIPLGVSLLVTRERLLTI